MAHSVNNRLSQAGRALLLRPLRNLGLALATFWLLAPALQAKDVVLVLRPQAEVFAEVSKGMTGDLGEDVQFAEVMVEEGADVALITNAMSTHQPKAVILVGNNAIKLYQGHQTQNPAAPAPPAIALAALFVDRFIAKLKNATGIRYEIPAVTSIVNLRALMSTPVKKVGVVYRAWMTDMVTTNARYAKAEGVELVGAELPDKDDNMNAKLKAALASLMAKKVDAIWMISDNELLNQKAFAEAWKPVLDNTKVPVIVGVKPLLNSKLGLGTFAVLPDHYALGVQAAGILNELLENDWQMEARDVEQPLSVKKIVNTTVMEIKGVTVQKDKLAQVDEVMQ